MAAQQLTRVHETPYRKDAGHSAWLVE